MLIKDKFSKKSIKKAVFQETVQKPATVYPAAIGILAAFAILLFGATTTTLVAAATGVALALGGWVFEYFGRGERYSLKYLAQMHLAIKEESNRKLEQLKIDLSEVNAQSAASQLNSLVNKFENFQTILDKKFSPGELTHSRYLGIAEQVFLAALDNLENTYLSLKSISAVDVDQLRQKVTHLQNTDSATNQAQLTAMNKRLALQQEQIDRVDALLTQNEAALTELDNVTTKLANVQTQKGRATVAMDLAMEELTRIAEQTDRYKHS